MKKQMIMMINRCQCCGGEILRQGDGTGKCKYCGTTYSMPTDASGKAEAFLQRAFICLGDGEFDKADELLEKALEVNPHYGKAYVGKLMAEYKIRRESDLYVAEGAISESANYQHVMEFGDEETIEFCKRCDAEIIESNKYFAKQALEAECLKVEKSLGTIKKDRKEQQRNGKKAEMNLKKMRKMEKRLMRAVTYNRVLKIAMILLSIVACVVFDARLAMRFGRLALILAPLLDVKIAFLGVLFYQILLDRKPHKVYEKLYGFYAKQWPSDEEILTAYQEWLHKTEEETILVLNKCEEANKRFQNAIKAKELFKNQREELITRIARMKRSMITLDSVEKAVAEF